MKSRRLLIEEALDVLVHHKRTLDFQWLATSVAKDKWPTLEATTWYSDGGEDATSYFTDDGKKRSLACSITGTLKKIKDDARRIRDRNVKIDVLVFATPETITQVEIDEWRKEIQKDFDHDLHVIPRSEIVAILEQPKNAWLCKAYLDLSFEEDPNEETAALKTRAGAARILAAWKKDSRFERIHPIELTLSLLRPEQTSHPQHVGLTEVCQLVRKDRRVLLQGLPGAGKSITLLQIADVLLNDTSGPIPIVLALAEWASTNADLIPFVAQRLLPEGVTFSELARLNVAGRLIFLLNGWNEVSSDDAVCIAERMRSAVRESASTSFIITTRDGDHSLPFSARAVLRIEPLNSLQKREIISRFGLADPSILIERIETEIVLADITQTPLFLAGVIEIAKLGSEIPKSRDGILRTLVQNTENAPDHQVALSEGPCRGFHHDYLSQIGRVMTGKGVAAMSQGDTLATIAVFSRALLEKSLIGSIPDAHAILKNLIDHHLLARAPGAGSNFRFIHQQFQEWFAAEWLDSRVTALSKDEQPAMLLSLQFEVLNHLCWQQPLAFLLERLSEGDGERRRIAAKVINWAMQIDLLLPCKLAGVAGERVWPLVRNALGDSLREWRARNSERHRHCALAAILATGAPDFQDILWPLLESPDQQVRLSTYRTWNPFPLTSLGAEWRHRFDGWDEERRVEFIQEMGWRLSQEHIVFVRELAKTDNSLGVRLACLRLLNDVEASETRAQILDAETFGEWAKDLSDENLAALPERCLGPFVPRLKASLADMQSIGSRNAIIEALHRLGDPEWPQLVKAEMDRILKMQDVAFRPANDWRDPIRQKPELPNAAPTLARYLKSIHLIEPHWVMDWLCHQLVQGQFWWEPFTDYLAEMPDVMLRGVADGAFSANIDANTIGARARLLGRCGSFVAVKVMVDKYLVFTASAEVRTTEESVNQKDALKHELHECPLQILVDVIVEEGAHIKEFWRLRELLGLIMPRSPMDSSLKIQLREHQKESLRSLAFRLEKMKSKGMADLRWFRAHLSVFVGAVGKPEDAHLLETWICDESRFRSEEEAEWKMKCQEWEASGRTKEHPGGRGNTVYWNWYRGALVQLCCRESVDVFLRLLSNPEWIGDAAWGLALLIHNHTDEADVIVGRRPKYSQIYKYRCSRQTVMLGETVRRYADAILDAIQCSLQRCPNGGSIYLKQNLVSAASALAGLDDARSIEVLFSCGSDKYSAWAIAEALHGLVLRGFVVSGKEASVVLEPFIKEHENEPRGSGNDNWYAVVRCLAVLLFSDRPAIGVERMRRLPPSRVKSYHARDLLHLLGACNEVEATALLMELSVVPEIHRHCFDDLVVVLSENVNPQVRWCLLDLLNLLCSGNLRNERDLVRPLAKALARVARMDEEIWTNIRSRCTRASSSLERRVLSEILRDIGDDRAALALCELIQDGCPIDHHQKQLIESVVLDRIPDGGSVYELKPRAATELRKRLFGIAQNDSTRRTSALELLAVIQQARLEYGAPVDEPIHPDIESLSAESVPWQLLR